MGQRAPTVAGRSVIRTRKGHDRSQIATQGGPAANARGRLESIARKEFECRRLPWHGRRHNGIGTHRECDVTTDQLTVAAPTSLTAQTRVEFKSAALECIEHAPDSTGGAFTIDMSATHAIDACGLGLLVMVTKRARERGLVTRLVRASDDVRSLLQTTRLEPLFQFQN